MNSYTPNPSLSLSLYLHFFLTFLRSPRPGSISRWFALLSPSEFCPIINGLREPSCSQYPPRSTSTSLSQPQGRSGGKGCQHRDPIWNLSHAQPFPGLKLSLQGYRSAPRVLSSGLLPHQGPLHVLCGHGVLPHQPRSSHPSAHRTALARAPRSSPPSRATAPALQAPHLSRRRPRLPATSASLLQPRPSGARSKLPLSFRSSCSGRRLMVALPGAGSGGPEGVTRGSCGAGGDRACCGSPHCGISRAGDPATAAAPAGRIADVGSSAPSARPLARSSAAEAGAEGQAGSAAPHTEEEAPLPPRRDRFAAGSRVDRPRRPRRGGGAWAGAGPPTVRACAARLLALPTNSACGGARFKPPEVESWVGRKDRVVAAGGGSGGGTTPGRLHYGEEACGAGASRDRGRMIAPRQGRERSGALSPAPCFSAALCRFSDLRVPGDVTAPALGNLRVGFLVLGIDVCGIVKGSGARLQILNRNCPKSVPGHKKRNKTKLGYGVF